MARLQTGRALALASVVGLCACAGAGGRPGAAEPPAAADPGPGHAAPSRPLDHGRLVEIALGSGALLAERTESECAAVAADAGWTTLADLVRDLSRSADEQGTSCEALAGGGSRCEVRFLNSTGGEDEEFFCLLELTVTESGEVDPASVRCTFAG